MSRTTGRNDLRVFILGPARSGTSALLLAVHDIFGLPGEGESHVIPAFQRAVYQFALHCEQFRTTDGVLARLLDPRDFQSHVLTYLRNFYASTVSDQGFVDKTPGAEAIAGAPLIRQAFPDARIIVTRRSGIAVVQSHVRQFGVDFAEACHGWTACMHAIEEIRPVVADMLEIEHAELATQPDLIADRIAVYLGQPEQSGPLADVLRRPSADGTPDREPWRPPGLADTGWTAAQRQQFQAICGEAMQRFGYPV